MEMMAIPGRSGEEAAIMDFIRGKLREAGVAAERARDRRCASPHAARRPGRQPGAEAAGHDARPAADALRPRRHRAHLRRFAPGAERRANRVSANKDTGLGGDDRAGAAVVLTTALAILRGKLPHPPLTFLWTVQEEVGLFGARYVKTREARQAEAGVQLRRRLAGEA